MDSSREGILEAIDAATHPDKMSKRDAKDWLEELYCDIQGRLDALVDELRDEEE